MKNVLLCFIFCFVGINFTFSQVTVVAQSFEGAASDTWGYTPSPAFGTFAASDDIWEIVSSLSTIVPTDGTMFVGGQDLDNPDNFGGQVILTFGTETITGLTNVKVQFDYEVIGYDSGDDFFYTVSINGSASPEVQLIDGMNGGGVSAAGTETINIPGGSTSVAIVIRIAQNGASDFMGIDNFKIIADATVPVSLTYFTGNSLNNNIKLNWATSQEINNDYFDIQRSSNMKDFETIGKVIGHGNITRETEYSFTDRNPSTGTNYYRLAQYDFNGDMEYHKVIAVANRNGNTTSVYPTLTNAELNIEVSEKSTLNIINGQGQLLRSETLNDSKQINVADLAPGIYYLQLNTDGKVETHKFVKI